MLRLVQELSFFWPLNAVMAGIFARSCVWLNRSYFYAVCFAAMLVYDVTHFCAGDGLLPHC
ncbi:hypothetical protein LNP17_15330 [Klebsiella variicola subsp. variicola]|nr:hypothetical protein [Klebsiella variicola subsp. variicola]